MTEIHYKDEVIEHLDFEFELPCEFQKTHEKTNGGPAVWVVWSADCCSQRCLFKLGCDPCLQYKLRLTSTRCAYCKTVFKPPILAYKKIEKI